MSYSKFIVSNQKEKFISIQRVKVTQPALCIELSQGLPFISQGELSVTMETRVFVHSAWKHNEAFQPPK